MNLEDTVEYRSYLCMASVRGMLGSDNRGSDGPYDDMPYFQEHITEILGPDIDEVFSSQHVDGVFGDRRWAFTDPASGFVGDDLHARLFRDLDNDARYLVLPPTRTVDDWITDAWTVGGGGGPDQFLQAAQLIGQVKPAFRDKIVLSGYSLGGALAAYAALRASWPVRVVVFDPLGLNRNMMGESGSGFFGQGEVLSDRYRSFDTHVDWFYIANSWVAEGIYLRHLSSVGRVTELMHDPARFDSHNLRNVRFGLHDLWTRKGWRGNGVFAYEGVPPLPASNESGLWDLPETARDAIAVHCLAVGPEETLPRRASPVNKATKDAILRVSRTLHLTGPTLFCAHPLSGAPLMCGSGGGLGRFIVRPDGEVSGRNWLNPVGVEEDTVPGWSLLALVTAVMALDMLAQREQRARQRRAEELSWGAERRYHADCIAEQRSADDQLTRAIGLVLDRRDPTLELALKSADDVFHRSLLWLEKHAEVMVHLVGEDGKVDYRQLKRDLGGDPSGFIRDLHLAHAAIAIRRKALLVAAAARGLTDPLDPYMVFRECFTTQDARINYADAIATALSRSLCTVRLRGGWPQPSREVRGQEHAIQTMAFPPTIDGDLTLQFLHDAAGKIFQFVPSPTEQ